MRYLPSMSALRAFEAAARHLSFKDAANELCVTPAAVSHQIQKLENELNTKLFQRLNKRVSLTDSGAKYLARLKLAFDNMEEATRELVQWGNSEVISLALPPTLLQHWILPRLESFYQKYPQFKLRILDTLRHIDLEKDQVDCAIRYGFSCGSGVEGEKLFHEDMCPVCSPSLLSGKKPLNSPEDLTSFRLLYTERRLVQWDNYLASSGYSHVKPQSQLWFSNSIHTLEATKMGLGVALANRIFVEEHIENGNLIIPFEAKVKFDKTPCYFFVSTKENLKKIKVLALKEWILEQKDQTANLIKDRHQK